jgi:hypothetical protein
MDTIFSESIQTDSPPGTKEISVTLYTWLLVFSTTSIITGLLWDISWHMSIGRDTLFSPPHLLIYAGGIVAGLGSIFKMFMITFSANKSEEREKCVNFWGFRAPLGSLFSIWGSAAMLTSAPFDDWWHNAYGLDVKILSPPHALLFLGMLAIITGAMLNVLALQNQQENSIYRKGQHLRYIYAFTAGIFLLIFYLFVIEHTSRIRQHNPLFYQIACGVFPIPLMSTMRGSRLKYPATAITAVYTIILLLQLWIFPLFPAQPKLAPILNPITHFVPLLFPLLLIVPGYALDRLFQGKISERKLWMQALAAGLVFYISFLVTHWTSSIFLNYGPSQNSIFMTHALPYYRDPAAPGRFEFLPYDGTTFQYISGFIIALLLAVLSSRIGLGWGNWMRRVQR